MFEIPGLVTRFSAGPEAVPLKNIIRAFLQENFDSSNSSLEEFDLTFFSFDM